jgi:protein-disulfide isomerase
MRQENQMLPPLTRRAALGGGLALAAFGPARAQTALESRGYALGDQTVGDPDAPVKVIEYASLTCSHCANFHRDTWPVVKEQYVDTGKAHFTFREVYFDNLGLWAGMLARCGGEETYFPMIDALMAQQRDWLAGTEAERIAAMQRIARINGLPADRINACLSDEDLPRAMVERFQETATADGIRSTPSFLINGDLHVGNMDPEAFSALIEAEL